MNGSNSEELAGSAASQVLTLHEFADIILEVSTMLLESGAHCERINRNIQRLAKSSNYKVDMLMSFTAISVTVTDLNKPESTYTGNKRIKHHGVHYGILSSLSWITWDVYDKKMPVTDLPEYLRNLKKTRKYPLCLVRLFIGIACGCLCLLAGGDYMDGAFAFVASFIGLSVRQIVVSHGFNLMIGIVLSAFVTTCISGMDVLFQLGASPEKSVATAVLFLIPGVPLINCIIDMIEGYIPVAVARGIFGGFILLCIAVGMFLSMAIIGVSNF